MDDEITGRKPIEIIDGGFVRGRKGQQTPRWCGVKTGKIFQHSRSEPVIIGEEGLRIIEVRGTCPGSGRNDDRTD